MAGINIASVLALSTTLPGQIQQAEMLIQLGVVTYQKIRTFFASQGHDDETLDAILSGATFRKARLAEEQAARDARAHSPGASS